MSERFLLINPVKGYVFPFSARGLTYIPGPITQFLERAQGDIFLDGTGALLKITNAVPTRTGIGTTVKLALKLPVRGEIKLAPVDMEFSAYKDALIASLRRTRETHQDHDETWWLLVDPIDEVITKVNSTRSLADLYAIMEFPADEDCLDLL